MSGTKTQQALITFSVVQSHPKPCKNIKRKISELLVFLETSSGLEVGVNETSSFLCRNNALRAV